MSIITLTTDFGSYDWFAGTLRGVILGINPRARIVDISHEIPPGEVRGAAFVLSCAYRFFPKGTVHVAIVDPGVGSSRDAIEVQTRDFLFVGPDNGVLSFALAGEQVRAAHRIENAKLFLQPVSQTFHGRDVFAPVAARLSRGLSIRTVGAATSTWNRLPWRESARTSHGIAGEVVYVDRYGNAITNITSATLSAAGDSARRIFLRGRPLCLVATFYQAVPEGRAVGIVGSGGFLEISVNGGSAAREHRLAPGDKIAIR